MFLKTTIIKTREEIRNSSKRKKIIKVITILILNNQIPEAIRRNKYFKLKRQILPTQIIFHKIKMLRWKMKAK